jgi:DNA primase
VIFPVHNLSGKVIAFGARMMGKEKNQPKYINSPETDIYHKSHVLYGLYQGKNAIRQHDTCFLVEGYTDVLSMHQAGVENVVASSGTALTEDQIKLIRRFTENVTVLFDGDAAGIKAALRGIDLILKGGLNVKVVLLPDGEDPDSYSRKVGTTKFQEYLLNSKQDFVSFKAALFAKDAGSDPIRRAEVIHDILNSVSVIPDFIKRTTCIQEVGRIFDMPASVLTSEVNKIVIQERRRNRDQPSDAERPMSFAEVHELSKAFVYDPEKSLKALEAEFVKVLISVGGFRDKDGTYVYSHLFDETSDVDLIEPTAAAVMDLYRIEVAKGNVPSQKLIMEIAPRELHEYLVSILVSKYSLSENWTKHNIIVGPEYEPDSWRLTVNRMKLGVVQKMLDDGLKRIEAAKTMEEQQHLIDAQMQIEQVKMELSRMLGRVVLRMSKRIIAGS